MIIKNIWGVIEMSRLNKYSDTIDLKPIQRKSDNHLETTISGKSVDLSDLDDFVVSTSPYLLRTMVDREVNKVQSQAAQYVFSMKGKRFPIGMVLIGLVIIVIIAVVFLVLGSGIDIGSLFGGFLGG